MVAFGLKRAAPGDAVVGVVVLVLIVLAVEVVVGGTVPVAVVVPGRVGTVTPGRGRVVTTVVTQPTTGRQSCGAAGALLVNAPADKTPATRIPAPTTTRAAVASLWRGRLGRREVMASLFFRFVGIGQVSTSANGVCNNFPPKRQSGRRSFTREKWLKLPDPPGSGGAAGPPSGILRCK